MTRNQWLGFGAAAFGAGFIAILALRRRPAEGREERPELRAVKTREEENDRLIHSLVVLTAGTAYLVMASGRGRKAASDGHEVFVARYVDWSITTPLLLTSLGLGALGTPFRRWGLLLSLLFTDAYMIFTGYLADEEPRGSAMKWTWYGISGAAMAGVYYMLWGPLMEEARKTGPEAEDLYRRNLTFLSAVWAGYPVNWLMGPEGLALFDEDRSTGIYTGLDITAKVLFGLYSLSNTQEKAARELAGGRVPEHELRPSPASHVETWERGSPTEGDAAPEAKPEPKPRRTRGKARAKPDSETA